MFNVVFFEPEIPPNTGNVIRLCSVTGCNLHLIKPLGFSLEDKKLRRAGLDYGEFSELKAHENWQAFLKSCLPARIFAISTKGQTAYTEIEYKPGDFLLFGPETRGLPDEIREAEAMEDVIRIPMLPEMRSLNLSNAASIIVYEAWRQIGFSNAE